MNIINLIRERNSIVTIKRIKQTWQQILSFRTLARNSYNLSSLCFYFLFFQLLNFLMEIPEIFFYYYFMLFYLLFKSTKICFNVYVIQCKGIKLLGNMKFLFPHAQLFSKKMWWWTTWTWRPPVGHLRMIKSKLISAQKIVNIQKLLLNVVNLFLPIFWGRNIWYIEYIIIKFWINNIS